MTTSKAWVAALIAALATLVATVQDRTDLDTMTAVDWVVVVLAAVVAGGTTYLVPNKTTATEPPEDPYEL